MTTNGNKIDELFDNDIVVYNKHYDFSSPVKKDVRPLFMSPKPVSAKKILIQVKQSSDNWKWKESEGRRERDSENKYDHEELFKWCERYITDNKINV